MTHSDTVSIALGTDAELGQGCKNEVLGAPLGDVRRHRITGPAGSLTITYKRNTDGSWAKVERTGRYA